MGVKLCLAVGIPVMIGKTAGKTGVDDFDSGRQYSSHNTVSQPPAPLQT
jgi:hypothetical protein